MGINLGLKIVEDSNVVRINQIDDRFERVDFARVHAWLSGTYWAQGVSQHNVEKAARNSAIVVGAYLDSEQVGYLRVVSDKTTFAWVGDVFVDERHRRKGVAL